METPGGLGGMASRFSASSVAEIVRAHETAWARAGADGEDRAMRRDDRPNQSFDASSTMQASIDEPLPDSNRGYRLLCRMGWRGRGTCLGRRGDGIVEPVRLLEQHGSLGLGKASEYDERAAGATESRRAMTSEVIASEDAEGRAAREAAEAKRADIADNLKRENAAFYCEICDKQYTKVMEFEEMWIVEEGPVLHRTLAEGAVVLERYLELTREKIERAARQRKEKLANMNEDRLRTLQAFCAKDLPQK